MYVNFEFFGLGLLMDEPKRVLSQNFMSMVAALILYIINGMLQRVTTN